MREREKPRVRWRIGRRGRRGRKGKEESDEEEGGGRNGRVRRIGEGRRGGGQREMEKD